MSICGNRVEVDDIQGLPLGPGPIMHDGSVSEPNHVAGSAGSSNTELSSIAAHPVLCDQVKTSFSQRVTRSCNFDILISVIHPDVCPDAEIQKSLTDLKLSTTFSSHLSHPQYLCLQQTINS